MAFSNAERQARTRARRAERHRALLTAALHALERSNGHHLKECALCGSAEGHTPVCAIFRLRRALERGA